MSGAIKMQKPLHTDSTSKELLAVIASQYDGQAENYDKTYGGPECQAEDKALRDFLKDQGVVGAGTTSKNVLDASCGQGLLLDLFSEETDVFFPQANYQGVDLSSEMLERARKKYPAHQWVEGDAMVPHTDKNNSMFHPDLVISLYGMLDYVGPKCIEAVAQLLKSDLYPSNQRIKSGRNLSRTKTFFTTALGPGYGSMKALREDDGEEKIKLTKFQTEGELEKHLLDAGFTKNLIFPFSYDKLEGSGLNSQECQDIIQEQLKGKKHPELGQAKYWLVIASFQAEVSDIEVSLGESGKANGAAMESGATNTALTTEDVVGGA